jgi:STE24 endopeptidase
MHPLTVIFLSALIAMVAVRLWLAARQARAIRAGAGHVPDAFAGAITGEAHARAAGYSLERLALGRIELVVDALVLVWLTLGGGLALIERLVARIPLTPLWHGVATLFALALVMAVIGLPFSVWSTFRIEARYGFNRMTPALFFADLLRALGLTILLGVPLLALVLALMQIAGRAWWLYAWGVWVAFGVVLTFLWPRYIAPLFNRFRPLEQGGVRARLEQLIERCGFKSEGLFVMDGSRRSTHGNAYFTGIGQHKRIVLFDTLLSSLDADEVEAVLAHELGHFRLHHVRTRLLLGFAASFVGFALLGFAATQPAWYQALGVPVVSAPMALALFALVVPVFTFWIGPLSAAWSRQHEFAADRYASVHASAAALARALVKLYRDNATTLTPDPVFSAWHDSHPPAPVRIAELNRLAAA